MKCRENFCFPTCSLMFLTSGNKWSPKHELRLSREWRNVLPSWWLRENHSRWANHHKVSPLVWMYTVRQKQTDIRDAWWRKLFVYIISILTLKNLLLFSVLKLVGDLGSDVQSSVVKDFSMVTHRDSNVRAVLFSDSDLLSPSYFLWSTSAAANPTSHRHLIWPHREEESSSAGWRPRPRGAVPQPLFWSSQAFCSSDARIARIYVIPVYDSMSDKFTWLWGQLEFSL